MTFWRGKIYLFRRVGAARKPRPFLGNRPRHGRKARERKSVTRQREKCSRGAAAFFIFQGVSFFRGTRERLDFGKNKIIFPVICKVVAKNNKILFSITFIFAGFTDIFAGDAHNQRMTMTKRRFIGEKRTDTYILYIFATNTHIIYNKFDIKELRVNCKVSDCE